MPTTTACPSCNGPLRLPDELVGQRVRCPVCQTIFDAAAVPSAPAPEPEPEPASAAERPLWQNLQLELDKSDPDRTNGEPAPQPASQPARALCLLGAVEVQPSGDEAPAPSSPPPRREPPSRREPPVLESREAPADYDDDEDHPRRSPYDRGPRRRDTEPHRGVLILVLGIISLVFTVFGMCCGGLVGLPLGVTAWILGSGDLRKIKNQEMDEEGLGITQAGWICGIIGTILHTLILLAWGAYVSFIVIQVNSMSPPPKVPFGAPTKIVKPVCAESVI